MENQRINNEKAYFTLGSYFRSKNKIKIIPVTVVIM